MGSGKWNSVPAGSRTVFGLLAKEFSRLDSTYENSLPDLSNSRTLLLGSDYSGEGGDAPYLVYSLILTSMEAWGAWERTRLQVRKEHFSDSRRMSFKKLGDGQRQRALLPILTAANSLEGLVFSLAINKRCPSLFEARPPLDLHNPQFAAYRKWKPDVLEKAFLVLHLSGLLLSGLATPGQDVLWFTDEDPIAANDQRVRELTQLFAWITSLYLTFNLGHCCCGTSRCDNGTQQVEDFLAIPDLVAGALGEQLTVRVTDPPELSGVFWMHRGDFSEKTNRITWWFSDASQLLKRLVCVVDPTKDGSGLRMSWHHFHDQRGQPSQLLQLR
jgi:hypothetical protein